MHMNVAANGEVSLAMVASSSILVALFLDADFVIVAFCCMPPEGSGSTDAEFMRLQRYVTSHSFHRLT